LHVSVLRWVTPGKRERDRNRRGSKEMANQLGKMYVCSKCGSQVIVTKSGSGSLKCCGQEMELKK
jgi:desulfoferrodoxin-like iron-binding protein